MFLYYIICIEYARQGSLQESIHLFLHGKSVDIYILKVQRRGVVMRRILTADGRVIAREKLVRVGIDPNR